MSAQGNPSSMYSSSLTIESLLPVSLGLPRATEEETHLEHCEENADGAKNSFGWCNTRDLLREIHGLDGHIQRGETTTPPLRSLGLGIHDPRSTWRRGNNRCENCEGGSESKRR